VTPAVSFTQPEQPLAVRQPGNIVEVYVHPRVIFFLEDGAHLTRASITQHDIEIILPAVKMQQHHLI
jgi:hypothetical protein